MAAHANPRSVPNWLIPAMWVALGCLLLALIGVAAFLLVAKMDFFSDKPMNDEQTKAVWTFVGVSLGAVVTLIGTLLAEQHNRRTAVLERQAEKRLTLDTVAKLLELLTENGDYAKPARVGGAIATMVELEGGTVALRILRDLWAADKVATDTVVWLIERVLNEDRPEEEQVLAASLLTMHARSLVPSRGDPEQEWYAWPSMAEPWPAHLPGRAKDALIVVAPRVLLARERTYWQQRAVPPAVEMLIGAMDDPAFKGPAAAILNVLLDLGMLDEWGVELEEERREDIRIWAELQSNFMVSWFAGVLDQFEPWGRGEDVQVSEAAPPTELPVRSPESASPRRRRS